MTMGWMFGPEGVLEICCFHEALVTEKIFSLENILTMYLLFFILVPFQLPGLHRVSDEIPWHPCVEFKAQVNMLGNSGCLKVISSASILCIDFIGIFCNFTLIDTTIVLLPLDVIVHVYDLETVCKDTQILLGMLLESLVSDFLGRGVIIMYIIYM